jgi:hypothetical protein
MGKKRIGANGAEAITRTPRKRRSLEETLQSRNLKGSEVTNEIPTENLVYFRESLSRESLSDLPKSNNSTLKACSNMSSLAITGRRSSSDNATLGDTIQRGLLQ